MNSIDYRLGESKVCEIIGPSGYGKSTLLYIMARSFKQMKGEALLNGVLLHVYKELISFVSQNLGLLPWKAVRENHLLPLSIKKETLLRK